LNITARPIDILRIRLRVRYDFEDLWNNDRLPQALWSYLDAALTVRERDMLRLRYDFRVFLDRRESTLTRVPNPEHWLWIEYVFRY
jgi:DNA-directed RNA polymerase sigma subunit (sigma70/sigma32)